MKSIKRIWKQTLSLLTVILLLFSLAGCYNFVDTEDPDAEDTKDSLTDDPPVTPPPPLTTTGDVSFTLAVPAADGTTNIITHYGQGIDPLYRGLVVARVANGTTADVQICFTKTATQRVRLSTIWLSAHEIAASDTQGVTVDFTTNIVTVKTVDIGYDVSNGGRRSFTMGVEEPGKITIWYRVEVYVALPGGDVGFALANPADNGINNTLTGGGSVYTVPVNVVSGSNSVMIIGVKTPAQSFAVSGADVSISGGNTINVNTSSVASSGGSKTFTLTVSEPERANKVYIFTVIVAPPIPIADKTFTVLLSAPTVPSGTATSPEIHKDTNVITIDDGAIKTYHPLDGNYALLNALLSSTGMEATDTFTFDGSGKISAIDKVATGSALTLNVTNAAGGLPVTAFASALTLTGNATKGIAVTGEALTGVTLKRISTDDSVYNFYGATITPNTSDTTAAGIAGNVVTLTSGNAATTVSVPSGSSLTGVTLAGSNGADITNATATTVITLGSSIATAKITASAAVTTVNASGNTEAVITVSGSSTNAVIINGVSIIPVSGADSVVTKTAGTTATLDAGDASATVNVLATSPLTELKLIATALAAITNASSATTIAVETAVSGVIITATAATTVDILATGDTVVLRDVIGVAASTIMGVSVIPTSANVTVTKDGIDTLSIDTAATTAVAVNAGTLTGLTITGTAPSAAITLGRGSVTLKTALTGVKFSTGTLAGGAFTIDKGNADAISIDGVSIAPDSTADAIYAKTAATKATLDAGNAGATVNILATSTLTELRLIDTALTEISNASSSTTIVVDTAVSGVKITATAATSVDIGGLAVGDHVSLTGNFAFTVKTIASSTAYSYTAATGVMTGGTTAGDRNYLLENTSVGSGTFPAAAVVGGTPSTTSFETVTPTSGGASVVVVISREADSM